jgi:hypothetical protein
MRVTAAMWATCGMVFGGSGGQLGESLTVNQQEASSPRSEMQREGLFLAVISKKLGDPAIAAAIPHVFSGPTVEFAEVCRSQHDGGWL